jgi:hypothetical protein
MRRSGIHTKQISSGLRGHHLLYLLSRDHAILVENHVDDLAGIVGIIFQLVNDRPRSFIGPNQFMNDLFLIAIFSGQM